VGHGRLDAEILGSNPAYGMDVCVHPYMLYCTVGTPECEECKCTYSQEWRRAETKKRKKRKKGRIVSIPASNPVVSNQGPTILRAVFR
jgi:hypothetical protein